MRETVLPYLLNTSTNVYLKKKTEPFYDHLYFRDHFFLGLFRENTWRYQIEIILN